MTTAIVWFRQDLRLHDNPALTAAVESGAAVLPVFVWSPEEDANARAGAASRWWLAQSLRALEGDLRARGGRLILRRGRAGDELADIIRSSGATAVFWNRRYEPAIIRRDEQVKRKLQRLGKRAESFNGSLLFEPWEISSRDGRPFRVYTPFSKACFANAARLRPVIGAPARLDWPTAWPSSLELGALELEPRVDWAAGFRAVWQPGEAGARGALGRFREAALRDYSTHRDLPGVSGTSRLSPHLHFGEVSPNQVWSEVASTVSVATGEEPLGSVRSAERRGKPSDRHEIVQRAGGAEKYLKELLWREFAYHLLFNFPTTVSEPLDARFSTFPWRSEPQLLRAWQRGRTGFPIVDAGMRELWATGWMHNRVRMIAASLLVKDLLISWRAGAAWFWDTLVDADQANNTLGWQWVAGCGADAAPFFRIFNPALQGRKFDPHGDYIRQWIPEIAGLPDEFIHAPMAAPPEVLKKAGIRLGSTYPVAIVDHAAARSAALAAYEHVKRASGMGRDKL